MPPRLILAVSIACLAGFPQPSAAAKFDGQSPEVAAFGAELAHIIQGNTSLHIRGNLVGIVRLKFLTDRQGRALACEALAPDASLLERQPVTSRTSPAEVVASVVEDVCWKTVFPQAPDGLYGPEGTLEVILPMIIDQVPEQDSGWLRNNAQRAFLHEHLVSREQFDSIGIAVISFRATAQGRVENCLVNLLPSEARPDAYKLDTALQDRLGEACMKLDMRQVPGFRSNSEAFRTGLVNVEYAPWSLFR